MLIEFNLLPWRDDLKRKEQIKIYLFFLASFFLSGLIVLSFHVVLINQLAKLEYHANFLHSQPSQNNTQKIAQGMQSSLSRLLKFFCCLSGLTDTNIHFYKMMYLENSVSLSGSGKSAADLVLLKNTLKTCAKELEFSEIHREAVGGDWQFKIKVIL